MNPRFFSLLPVALAAALLAACGGSGGDDSPATPATPPGTSPPVAPPVTPPVTPPAGDASRFTQKASWVFELPAAGSAVCYDFDTQTEVPGCSGKAWDLKVKSGGRTAELFSNSGASGSGAGGAFGSPFTHSWSELQGWKDALIDPASGPIPATLYFPDAAGSVFSGSNGIASGVFEYAIGGDNDHLLYPNHRVFLVTTHSALADTVGTAAAPVYALQVTGYYGGPGGTTSGYPTLRWMDRLSQQVRTTTLDASKGWTYFNLTSAAMVGEADGWHVAFNRNTMKLNGGASGPGTVAGFVGATPAGFYDADGKPVLAKFKGTTAADTLASLTGVLATPASARDWVKDSVASQLAPPYTGSYPAPLDYGWFTYYPTDASAMTGGLAGAHQLKANPERATLLRSGEGKSYARMRVASIVYGPVAAPAQPYTGKQTWTIDMDVQPAR